MDTWIVSSLIESGASLTVHHKRQVSGAGFTEGCMPLAAIKHGLFILAGDMEWMCAAASWETRHWAAAPLHWYLMMSSHKGVSHLHLRPIPIITRSGVTADMFVLVEHVAEAIFRQMVRAERMMSTAVQSPTLCKKGSGVTVLLLIFNCGHWRTDTIFSFLQV